MRLSLLVVGAVVSVAAAFPLHHAREPMPGSLSGTQTVKEAQDIDAGVDARSLGGRLSEMSNAERMQRGLPPKAPKRRFDSTQTAKRRSPSSD